MSFNILNNVYQHYDVLSERIPKSKHNEYFSKRLRAILSYPQYYIYNSEVDINNYSSIYYFEHIKEELIKLISTQVHADDREILLHENRNHILFKDTLYDVLIKHNLKDLIIPFFIWLSYFNDNNLNLIKGNMEYLKNKGFSFQSIDELYNLGRGNTFFRLPYISENNKEFLQYVCKFMRSICLDLTYKRKYVFDNVKQENKIQDIKIKHKEKLKKRVGFISERLKTDSSVLRDRFKIIENLDRDLFEVFIIVSESEQFFYKHVKGNFALDFYKKHQHEFIFLPKNINESRSIIDFLNLDVIVYCEIGMDYKPYLLSYSRLAPIQINTWGHSETSGIDTIDYFISSELYEQPIDISREYYSEKLVLTKSLCTCYPKFDFLNEPFKTREELGFHTKDKIFSCLQASFKVSITMEDIIELILEKCENSVILFSIAFAPFCQKQLARMFSKFKAQNIRIKFFKVLSLYEYLNLINISDIVLDTYPFGGCNSSLEAFYLDKPVVSWPTNKINGRFTYGFYKKMDINECIAKNKEDYINKCVKLSNDIDFYNLVQEKIKLKKHLLFLEQKSIDEWNNILNTLK